MFKVNNRSTRHCSGVCIIKFEYFWPFVLLLFFADFEDVNAGWNTFALIKIYLCVSDLWAVIFKMKLSVRTVNNSFCHKELHLRCCIRLELNIVTTSTKILNTNTNPPPPIDQVHHSPRCPKTLFPEVFHIKLYFCIEYQMDQMGLISTHWHRLFHYCKLCIVYLVKPM